MNIIKKICAGLILILLTAGLAACNGDNGDNGGDADNGNGAIQTPAPSPSPSPTQAPSSTAEANAQHQWTIEELGATIEAAGQFWNDWWHRNGAFSWDNIDDSRSNFQPFDENIAPAHHPVSRGFSRLLPSSGFASLDEIGDHLLQFYTQAWVNRGQFAEPVVFADTIDGEIQRFGWINAFEEYGGNLYIFTWNESQPRPVWQTAIHILIEQDGNRAVVETAVSTSIYGFEGGGVMPTITYRFTFIDGVIDSAYGRWYDDYAVQEPVGQGFYVPIAAEGDTQIFIYRAVDVNLDSFDAFFGISLPNFGDSAIFSPDVVIGATRTIYNISLVVFEDVFEDHMERDHFTVTDYFWLTDVLQPGEGIVISGYISDGSWPWSGITFTTAPGERHFFAFFPDDSENPYWFMLWDITRLILAG